MQVIDLEAFSQYTYYFKFCISKSYISNYFVYYDYFGSISKHTYQYNFSPCNVSPKFIDLVANTRFKYCIAKMFRNIADIYCYVLLADCRNSFFGQNAYSNIIYVSLSN